ncbi:FecR family protein [Pedobacter nyackensis]|uniref:FecR family protein n=1 Tax=Pedobacter nyackensis TaxID=475255 RepID=UPI0029300C61|nr:FecR domain-containing protein [Pedobacter nyackensis]
MTEPTRAQLNQLADKWLKGTLTPQEKEILDKWYDMDATEPLTWTGKDNSEEELSNRLLDNVKKKTKGGRTLKMNRWISAAAVLLISASAVYLWLPKSENKDNKEQVVNATPIKPGTNRAVLTLANGEKINLNDTASGQIAVQSGIRIIKTPDGGLIYEAVNPTTNKNTAHDYNTIEAPLGGQWQVILPDRSHVWLNAKSRLKYPVNFRGKERKVELEGEAYFEVTKDKQRPFMVVSKNQEITVLGTHFNVNAYPEETAIKTTLIEGAVVINKKTHLKPGQQSIFNQGVAKVVMADVEMETAWKNGRFIFDGQDFKTIVNNISRWYDVDISYDPALADLHIGGRISRTRNLEGVLKMLEGTGDIKIKIEGRRISMTK